MARSAAEIMVRIAGAAAVAASEAIAEVAEEVLEVEVAVFEEAVAGADGTMGRFRSGGGFPDARQPRTRYGEVS